MHGGTIYIRGDIADHKLGKEVKKIDLDDMDIDILDKYIGNYCRYFSADMNRIRIEDFIKLIPFSHSKANTILSQAIWKAVYLLGWLKKGLHPSA